MPGDAAFDEEALALLQALLRIDTSNPPGNERPAAELLAESLRQDGLDPEIFEPAPTRANLVARLEGNGTKPPLLLTAHLDVVPAEAERWSHPPFAAEIHDGWLYGRGAVDMKHMAAMGVMVLKRLRREGIPLARDVVFAAVADEEAGCEHGSKFLAMQHPDKVRAEFALGEIGGFTLRIGGARLYPVQVAQKGVVWLKAVARGTPGHGSIPREDQAVHKLALALARLGHQKLPVHLSRAVREFVKELQKTQPILAKIGLSALLAPSLTDLVLERLFSDRALARSFDAVVRNTAVATVVRAGYKTNVIPAQAEAEIDGRIVPGQTSADLLRELSAVLGDEVELSIVREMEPLEVPGESPLMDAIRAGIQAADPQGRVVPYIIPGFTDGGPFSKLGITYYGFAPIFFPEEPRVAFADLYHGHDERIPVEGFHRGLACLYEVVRRFCAADQPTVND